MSVLLFLKKLFARLFFPLPLTLLLLLAGVVLLWPRTISRRRKTLGLALIVSAALLLLFGGTCGELLLKPLTTYYAPLDPATLSANETYVIAIAGNAFYDTPELPPAHRFNQHMLLRLSGGAMLAAELEKRNVSYQIVVSLGHPTASEETRLNALHAYFGVFGIAPERIAIITNAQNTRQEIREFGKFPGKILLVSQAFHLPRMMILAKKYQLDALPAPIGGLNPAMNLDPLFAVPDAIEFYSFQTVVYELLGILESKIF